MEDQIVYPYDDNMKYFDILLSSFLLCLFLPDCPLLWSARTQFSVRLQSRYNQSKSWIIRQAWSSRRVIGSMW